MTRRRIAKGNTRNTRVIVEFVLAANEPHDGINPELLNKLVNVQGATWSFVEAGLAVIGVKGGSLKECSRELRAEEEKQIPRPRARRLKK